jgi:hypothetical protein
VIKKAKKCQTLIRFSEAGKPTGKEKKINKTNNVV